MTALAASPWARRSPRRRGAGAQDKREAVLRAAAQLFNEKGFHATSLDEVAERLQVTKPTLYRYVESKDQILFECVRSGLRQLHDGAEASRAAGGSALDQLVAAMRTYAQIVTADFGMCVIRIGEDPLPAADRSRLRGLKRDLDLVFRRLIEQAIAEGSLRACDARLAAFTLAGALSWIGRWYRHDGPLSPRQIADSCVDLLLRGVLVPATPAATATTNTTPGRKTPTPTRRPR